MNLTQFLQKLVIKGCKFRIEDNHLKYSAPKKESTPEVINKLKEHRAEILQLLNDYPDILDVTPLSYGQKALWFFWQLDSKSSAYNLVFSVRICDEINIKNLRLAFEKLIDRHSSLRSTFSVLDFETIQYIHQTKELDFLQIDASFWNETQLYLYLKKESQLPFDLEQGSIMRVRLYTCSEKEHILLFTIHHIAVDGWSLKIK